MAQKQKFVKNGHFGKKWKIWQKKNEILAKMENLVNELLAEKFEKNRKFGQKINILTRYRNFSQKSKFYALKIRFLPKNVLVSGQNLYFWPKLRFRTKFSIFERNFIFFVSIFLFFDEIF